MPTLTVRDVPRALHAWLRRRAGAHRRSVNQEVIALLEALHETTSESTTRLDPDQLLEIGRRCAAMPELDSRSAEEVIGYDEHGLPR